MDHRYYGKIKKTYSLIKNYLISIKMRDLLLKNKVHLMY
ncbi:hypothetical protein CBDKU1_01950 [Clostridium butyricum DKU-01]|nr:hypothetical protein CBDKU1_01950 [Clostridium butyricum DKU-01]